MSQNSSYALNYFVQQGYTPSQAAGIVGNLMQESGLNPAVSPGDNGKSFGIAQWNGGRLTALQDYAKQQGSDWKSLDTQLGFVNQELNGSENKAGQAIRNAQDVASATAAAAGYERPQGWAPDNPSGANAFDKRLAYASQLVGGNGIDAPASNVTTSAQSLVNPPLASAAMVKPTAPDAFSQLQNAQPTALSQLFGGGQQQPMQAQAQQPEISDQDVAAELQRRGLAPQAQTMPDISDDQVKQELQRRGLGQAPDLFHATPEQRQSYVNSISSTPQQHSDAYNMTMRPLKSALAGAAGFFPDMIVPSLSELVNLPSNIESTINGGLPDKTSFSVKSAIQNFLDKQLPTDQAETFGGYLGPAAAEVAGGLGAGVVVGRLAPNNKAELTSFNERQYPPVADPLPAAVENNPSIPMSAGQKTQNPNIQRVESDIVAGAKGSKAQQVANDFRAMQNEAMQEHISSLGAAKEGANPADNIGTISKVIQSNAGLANEDINAAYGKARELADTGTKGVALSPKDIKENLLPDLKEIAKDYTIDSGATPKANTLLNRLKTLMTTKEGSPQTSSILDKYGNSLPKDSPLASNGTSLTDLEGWRKAASLASRNASDPAERAAIRKMIEAYDDYMGSAAERMTGQTGDAINAFKQAVSSRAAYGKQFQGNDLVESIVEGKTSVDDLTKQLLGSGSVGGKQGMLDNYRALVKAAGDKAPVVQKQLQDAFAQKIYETASKGAGKLANSETQAISPARMKTALENLFVNQRDLATELYGKDAVDKASQVIKELGQITSKQANVGNASNSGYTAIRLAKANAATLLSHIPGFRILGSLAKVAGEHLENEKAAEEAVKLFTGKIPKSLKGK